MHAKPLDKLVEATITSARRGSQAQKEQLLSHVFVLDAAKQPLDPVPPGQARILLTQGKAAVYRRYPFTIILKINVPLEVEHLVAKAKGGTDRVSNLCLACHPCNDAKGDRNSFPKGRKKGSNVGNMPMF